MIKQNNIGTEDSLVHLDWVESTRKRLEEKQVFVEFKLIQDLEHEVARGQIDDLMSWLEIQMKR